MYITKGKKVKVKLFIAKLCPIHCNPMDSSLPGSSVHRILHARVMEWVTIPFSRGFHDTGPRDPTPVSCIAGRFFTMWAIWSSKATYDSNYIIFWNAHTYWDNKRSAIVRCYKKGKIELIKHLGFLGQWSNCVIL